MGRNELGSIERGSGSDQTIVGTQWIRPPFFMLRIGGLSAEVVRSLRSPAGVDWAERVLASERSLAMAKDHVADRLQSAVGGLGDEQLRRKLLEVRRHVFNLRLPKDGRGVEQVAAALDSATADLLLSWFAERRRHQEDLESGERILAAEAATNRAHLRELVEHPNVRQGLLLASPSLDRYLPSYLSAAEGRRNKRARRIERSVLEYVYRTACKTSPFSTFTAVGLGRFDASCESLLRLESIEGRRSHVRLNLAVLARIVAILMSDPGLRGDLPAQVTLGWRRDRNRIRYVRRQQHHGDDDASVSMDTVRENLFYLTSSSVLHEVFDVLPEGRQLKFSELARRLTSSQVEQRDRAEVESYLAHLVRLGLLVAPTLHVDIHAPDPVRDFCSGIRKLDPPWAARLADHLDAVSHAVTEFATAALDERRELLGQIRLELTEAQHDLGAVESTIPRTILYEDVSLVGTPPQVGTAAWDEVVTPALAGLARILPVFDMTLPQRLVTRGYFRARYGAGGRCDDVVRFVHEFHQDFNDQYSRSAMQRREFDENNEYTPQPNWLNQPEIAALDEARRVLVAHMRRLYAAHPSDDVELVLDDAVIDDVAAALPDELGDIDPHCFFLQIGQDGERPFAVLNRAYSGLTLQFSRFAHCFPDAEGHGLTAGLRATLAEVCPPGAVFAELKGGYETTNLNLHPAVTPFELVCPGEASFRPAGEQILVDDLYVEDDNGTRRLRLRSRRLGAEVIPVYLGFLVPMVLPEMQRLLLNFSYSSMARIDLWSGVDRPLGDDLIGGHPRVRHRDLVITRRLWKTHPRHLPQRGPDQSESGHFLDWVRWHRDNGLPRRVFVTPDLASAADRDEDPGGRPAAVGTTKPQYVDFDSQFSLSLLDATVKSATQRLVFTEMLPDLDQLWLRPDGLPHVTELTVEIDGVPRRAR